MNHCPHCLSFHIKKRGHYFVKHSRSYKRRYICLKCRRTFSSQTNSLTRGQKKPFLNRKIFLLITNGNSQRGAARILGCNKNTIELKLQTLFRYEIFKEPTVIDSPIVQIDEMESIEHTKLKPLTIPLCVSESGKLIAANIGKIPAKGHLAEISRKKYGHREDQRLSALILLFEEMKRNLKTPPIKIITDEASLYAKLIKQYFPEAKHEIVNATEQRAKKREMVFTAKHKKLFDPLFAINHECAMLRDRIKRLTRRSWCTTKRVDKLYEQIKLYQSGCV